MKVPRFEELIAWRKAKSLCVQVYRVTGTGRSAQDFGLRDQIQRAPVSVNVEHRGGIRPELARFLTFARGSAGEVRSQLYLAAEPGYVRPEEAAALLESCNEVTRILVAPRKSLDRSYQALGTRH